jgi:spermidine/putrescine-binding protein
MKVYRTIVSIILLSLLIAACGGGQATATKSTELNLYAWSEYVPQTLLDNLPLKQVSKSITIPTPPMRNSRRSYRQALRVMM